MAATDFVWGRTPIQGADVAYKNTSGSTITVGQLLKLDTGNLISASQPLPGMTPCTGVTDFPVGFAVENTPNGQTGRVQIEGVAVGIAAGAVTAGAIVGASATAGDVTTYTATDPSIGQAWNTTTTAADPILVRIAASRNA